MDCLYLRHYFPIYAIENLLTDNIHFLLVYRIIELLL